MGQDRKTARTEPGEVPVELPERARGARFLCMIAGVALVSQSLLTGLLATPFFGADAFVWGNVLGAFVLSLGVGMGFGDRLGVLAGGVAQRPWRLVTTGGLLTVLGTWALPRLARAILDRDPDSPLAPAATFAMLIGLPGILLASTVPCVLADLEVEGDPLGAARSALRRFALSMLGGLAGLAVALYALRFTKEAPIHLWLYGLGGGVVATGLLGLGNIGRVVALAAGIALGVVVAAVPSEVSDPEFRAAITEALALRSEGTYYASKAAPHVIKGTDLERRIEVARSNLQGADKKIAILLVVETLRGLGPINISGDGLKTLFDTYLPPTSKPLVLPFVEQVSSVQSDGRRLHFVIKRSLLDHGAHFQLPGKEGEPPQEFAIRDDFDITVTVMTPARSGEDAADPGLLSRTKLEIGPQTLAPKHFFDIHDTLETPFVCKDVALNFDACLLAIIVENKQDSVVVKVQAQASIGAIQTQVLQVVSKTALK